MKNSYPLSSPQLVSPAEPPRLVSPAKPLTAALFLLLFLNLSTASGQIFTRVTTGPFVTTIGDSRSVNWLDVNGDQFVDCQITNGPNLGQNNMLYINDQLGGFTALTGDPIVLDGDPSDGATWADTDNDGDLDCFVVNWYGINNMYFKNDGSGAFTRITGVPPAADGGYSETAAWGDYDTDGYVDLYVTNSAGLRKNFLYHNDADTAFTKITTGELVTDNYHSRCVNWTDIDLDNDLDLFVTNEGTEDENLYRNDGGGVFTKVTGGALLTDGGSTMSSSWGDIDNDGDFDVFLANDAGTNAIFRNDGGLVFTRLGADTTANTAGNSFSSAWADVDNDADLDLFVTNSFKPSAKCVNYLYLNDGTGSFTRLGATEPLTLDSGWTYGCAFADYDNDGFEDLAAATCRYAGVDQPDLLYHNNGNTNHWLTIRLTGTLSNRAAIGAKVKVLATVGGFPTWQIREISAQSSYCGQNDIRAHFGLGDATTVDSVMVIWPSKTIEVYTGIEADGFIHIEEGTGIVYSADPTARGDRMMVYPNPSSGAFTLRIEGKPFVSGDQITITDLQGRLVYSAVVTGRHQEWKVICEALPGTYLLTHRGVSSRTTIRIFLQ